MKIYANELEYRSIVSPEEVVGPQRLKSMTRTLSADLMLFDHVEELSFEYCHPVYWDLLMMETVVRLLLMREK